MSQYVKECTFCKAKIQMSDKSGSWLPYNQDGSQHDCKKNVPSKPKQDTKDHDMSEYKMKEVRLGSITDDLAEKIAETLDNNQIMTYKRIGPRLLDVYAEVQVWKK